ncbi:unnamed protein product [Amoebophrya sp. A120]|nr:unnamed protein product [Amoebophrya sp. A120]|eukprot:GSA120T00017370001.1
MPPAHPEDVGSPLSRFRAVKTKSGPTVYIRERKKTSTQKQHLHTIWVFGWAFSTPDVVAKYSELFPESVNVIQTSCGGKELLVPWFRRRFATELIQVVRRELSTSPPTTSPDHDDGANVIEDARDPTRGAFFCFSNNGTFLMLTLVHELKVVTAPRAVWMDCAPGELRWSVFARVMSFGLPQWLQSVMAETTDSKEKITIKSATPLASNETKCKNLSATNKVFLRGVARLCNAQSNMQFVFSEADTLCEPWFIRACMRERVKYVASRLYDVETGRVPSTVNPVTAVVFSSAPHCCILPSSPAEYKKLVHSFVEQLMHTPPPPSGKHRDVDPPVLTSKL